MTTYTDITQKCIVKDCTNRRGQEGFEGPLCILCHQFIIGTNLVAMRNVLYNINDLQHQLQSQIEILASVGRQK